MSITDLEITTDYIRQLEYLTHIMVNGQDL